MKGPFSYGTYPFSSLNVESPDSHSLLSGHGVHVDRGLVRGSRVGGVLQGFEFRILKVQAEGRAMTVERDSPQSAWSLR